MGRKLRVLNVEDSPDDSELMIRSLGKAGYEVEHLRVDTAAAMQAALEKQEWDLVVSDYSMPNFSGLAALGVLLESGRDIPFILASGTIGEDAAVQAMKAGAHDYLLKDNLHRLGPAVERELREAHIRRAHRQAETRQTAFLEAAMDSILTFDHLGKIQEFNPAATTVFGLSRASALERHIGQLIKHPSLEERDLDGFVRRISEGPGALLNQLVEATAMRANGREFPVEMAVGRFGAGESPGFIVCLRDISQRKQAQQVQEAHQEEIERINRELERKNQKLAELYSNAQRFVDNVSHEFRTPLTVIKGYADVMLRRMAGTITAQQEEFLNFIADRTRDLAQMVDDLLDSSKLRAGTLRVDRRMVSVAEIVRGVRPVLLRTAAANRMKLVENLPENLPNVFADAEKAGRVLINLVVNAIKFSPPNSEVTLWAAEAEGGGVEIGVTDRGPGIAPENVAAIFERFKQFGEAQTSNVKGFGLGLNIAKELVAMNLGTINVKSQVGKGSTFSFTLPPTQTSEVLRRHLEYIDAQNDPPETLAAIQLETTDANPIDEELRRLIASTINPCDLILEGTDGSLLVVGCSADPERFAQRLAETGQSYAARPNDGHPHSTIRVASQETWPYPARRKQAIQRITQLLANHQIKETIHA